MLVNPMNDIRKTDEIEIDLGKILRSLVRNRLLIVVAAAAGTAAAFLLTLMMTPKYKSSVTFYVKNNSMSAASSISSADLAASKELVDSYLVILQSEETLDAVIHYAQVDRTYAQMKKMIAASAVNSTEFFKVEVTSTDPREAERIANAIGRILPLRIAGIMEGASVKIVDAALISFDPSEPGYGKITAAGFAAGLALCVLGIVLQAVLEKTIRSEGDIQKACSCPILGRIREKDNYLSQSYKTLGAKLRFCLPEDGSAKVIAVTAPRAEEGASTVAVNLSCCLRRQGKKVILIDCDLCGSKLAKRQKLEAAPGLADFLAGKCALDQTIRQCFPKQKMLRFPVIPAGKKYVRGTELLSSKRMKAVLRTFRKICDYVILDLPPLEDASETVELAKAADGVLLVAGRDRGNRESLNGAVEQLKFADARILGIAYNGAEEK